MRRMMTALACQALVAGSWSAAPAQEAEYSAAEYEGRLFNEIVEFDVAPAHAAGFETAMKTVVEAANLANLSSDYGWMMFRDGHRFTLVYPVENMAYFDDEEQWMRQFAGTPGEEKLGEAFATFGEIDYSSKSMVHKVNLAHTYEPADPIENPNHVMVYMTWVKPGKQEAFAENTAGLIGIIKDVQWRYAVHAYDGVIGDGGVRYYVVPFDDLSTFHGEGSLSAYLAQHERGEDWQSLWDERVKLVRAMDSYDLEYVPDMTYMPTEGTD